MDSAASLQQAAARLRAEQSFLYFLTWCQIRGSEGGVGAVPFALYDYQNDIARSWEEAYWAPIIAGYVELKPRQVGFSWTMAAFGLWGAMYHQSSDVGIFSKGEKEVKEQMARVKYIYQRLPEWLRVPWDPKVLEISFEGASKIVGFPSTEDAGIGYDFKVILVDEAAAHDHGQDNFGNYVPTLHEDGCIIICSTASPTLGPQGFFYDTFTAARRGKIDFLKARFTPWWVRPPRYVLDEQGNKLPSQTWYNRRKSMYVGKPEHFNAHYPATPEEAFVGRAGLVFPNGPPVGAAPCGWKDYKWRIAGVDWGGGDPTVVVPIGVTANQFFHQTGEFYRKRPTGIQEVYGYLAKLHDIAPFWYIACDPSNRSAIETLKGMGLPAIAANNRRDGLDTVRMLHDEARFTINPECYESIIEYDGYRWAERQDSNAKTRYMTSTPVDNHADAHDARRYALVTAVKHLPQKSMNPITVDAPRHGGVVFR